MSLCKTELFHDVSSDEIRNPRFSRFGYNQGNVAELETYIEGYKIALEALIIYYESLDPGECDKLDEIVYPIFFVSRHIVELYLKLLGIRYCKDKYGNVSNTIMKSHELLNIFREIKSKLEQLCIKAEIDLCSQEIEDYLNQIEDYDKQSYCFRYPFDINRNNTFIDSVAIDITDFYQKIINLYEHFQSIYSGLYCMVGIGTYNHQLGEWLYKNCVEQIENVEEILNILEKNKELVPKNNKIIINLADVPTKNIYHEQILKNYINSKEADELRYVNLLLFTGRDLCSDLKISTQNIKEDFCKILVDNYLNLDFIKNNELNSSGFNPNYKILQTKPKLLIKWFDKSLSIIEKIESNNDGTIN